MGGIDFLEQLRLKGGDVAREYIKLVRRPDETNIAHKKRMYTILRQVFSGAIPSLSLHDNGVIENGPRFGLHESHVAP